MLSLCIDYHRLQKEPATPCGCSSRCNSILFGLAQVTLLVIAILALAKVGCFEQVTPMQTGLFVALPVATFLMEFCLLALRRANTPE